MVSSTQDKQDQELQHIKTALQACQFPNWALNQLHHRFLKNNQGNNNNHTNNNNTTNKDSNPTKRNITLVVPFIPGTSEKFKKLCKGTNTLRTLLGNPKDKDPKTNKSGIIYHYKCPHINCPDAYIGESGRALGESKNISRHPPLFTNTAPKQDTHWIQTTSTLYIRRLTVIPGPSRKLCSSASLIPPLTGTWVNTSCHTYGTTYYRHHQHYSSSLPACLLPHPLPNHTPFPQPTPTTYAGGLYFSW